MRSLTGSILRFAVMGLVAIGLTGLTMNPATAREICNPNGMLAVADGNGDGVVSRGEIQAIIDAAQGVEGVEQLQSLLNGLPGDVTGIRYTGCTPDGGGNGNGDDGSGNGDDGSGSDDGAGSGNGSGAGDGAGAGDDSGTGDGSGSGTGTGDGSGTDSAGSGEGGTVVINAEGTPVNSITGLPDTGQMPAGNGPGSVSMWLLLCVAGVVTGAGALALRSRPQAR